MADASKIRVTAFLNGDFTTAGKVLVIAPNAPVADVIAAASKKLLTEDDPTKLTRVFLESGAEVTESDEIVANDKLFFSAGEEFIKLPESSSGDETEKAGWLSRLAYEAVAQAGAIYGTTSTFVKERSPEYVKTTIESVEGKVSHDIKPKVVEIVSPVLTWADGKLDSTYDRVRRSSLKFLESDFAKSVNESLVVPIKVKVVQPSEAFFRTAVASFQTVREKSANGAVSAEEFVAQVKKQLGTQWNDKLLEPAKAFYAHAHAEVEKAKDRAQAQAEQVKEQVKAQAESVKAQAEQVKGKVQEQVEDRKQQLTEAFANVKSKLGEAWEQAVISSGFQDKQAAVLETIQTRVRAPAEAFFRSAVDSYHVLASTATDGKVSYQEFVAGLRVKLSNFQWSDKLLGPAQYLYDTFKQVSEKAQSAQQPHSSTEASASASASTSSH